MSYDPETTKSLSKPEMPDLRDWLATLRRFVHHMDMLVKQGLESGKLDQSDAEEFETVLRIEAPVDSAKLNEINSNLPAPIPASLGEFFLTASKEIQFRYAFDLKDEAPDGVKPWLTGGEHISYPDPIFSIAKLGDYQEDVKDHVEDSDLDEFPEEREIWLRSFPFYRFNNSNFLALDSTIDSEDPPVIHLDHEGEPELVARNLAEFLIVWPQVCFVGPGDFYDLECFVDEDRGTISGNSTAALGLRKVLGWER